MTSTLLTRLSRSDIDRFYAAGYWQDATIYALTAEHALAQPDAIAIREHERTVTYAQLIAAADALVAELAARGVRAGQRVAVWLPSRAEVAVALLACSRGGLVLCPSLHRTHTVAEVIDLARSVDARVIVTQAGYGADASGDELLDAFANQPEVITYSLPAGPDAPVVIGTAVALGAPAVSGEPDSIVYLAFTSGTTGQPKGVMHSDNTLLANARTFAKDWDIDASSVVYSLSPLSHNLGFGALVMTLTHGGEFVVHDLPRGESLLERLIATGATFAFGVPTHAIDLLAELTDNPRAQASALRGFRISGAAVASSVAQGLLDHGIVPQSGYGMTEAGSHHYTRMEDPPERVVSTSGRVCESYEVRIVDRDDPQRELPAGEVGQIAGRGASLMLGYFDNQRATEESFSADGWFLTGDLGWVDEDGYIRITGRKKDVIIRGGHNIFPARIEELAARHPAVANAAAVGVADDRLGEKVCLVVVCGESGTVTADELLTHLSVEGLSRFDKPEFVAWVDALPLTASGKITKQQLAHQIADGTVVAVPVRFDPDVHMAADDTKV